MNDKSVISTRSLTKHFGAVVAVDDLSLTVHEGEIYGFLGLNGAGKTTTIRMLLGLIRPTSGTATILGEEIRAGGKGPWDRVGSLVETPSAYPNLNVRENLEIFRRLRGIDEPGVIDRVVERLSLSPYLTMQARHLSLGNMQRLGIAKALLHGPKILLLDEPANGLDPAGIVDIRELLISLAREHGITVFVSSHILDEVERLATKVGIIHEGRLLHEVSAKELRSLLDKRLIVGTGNNTKAREILSGNGFADIRPSGQHLEIRDGDALEHPERVAELLVRNGIALTALWTAQESLEDFFLRTTNRHDRGKPR